LVLFLTSLQFVQQTYTLDCKFRTIGTEDCSG